MIGDLGEERRIGKLNEFKFRELGGTRRKTCECGNNCTAPQPPYPHASDLKFREEIRYVQQFQNDQHDRDNADDLDKSSSACRQTLQLLLQGQQFRIG